MGDDLHMVVDNTFDPSVREGGVEVTLYLDPETGLYSASLVAGEDASECRAPTLGLAVSGLAACGEGDSGTLDAEGRWLCADCEGKGCEECGGTGLDPSGRDPVVDEEKRLRWMVDQLAALLLDAPTKARHVHGPALYTEIVAEVGRLLNAGGAEDGGAPCA